MMARFTRPGNSSAWRQVRRAVSGSMSSVKPVMKM